MSSEEYPLTRTIALTVALTGFVAAIYGFGIYLFSVILPDMKGDIGFSYATAGIITGLAQISFMLFAIVGGVISSRLGGGRACLLSVLVCGVSLVVLPTLNTTILIGGVLVLLGGMAASGYVPIVDVLTRFISYKDRGKIMGLISSGTSFGVFVNGLIVPPFILEGNWRGIWFTVGGVTLAWVVMSFFIFRHYGVLQKRANNQNISSSGGNTDDDNFKLFTLTMVVICSLTFLNGFTVMPFQNFLAPYLRDELSYSVSTASQIWSVIGFFGMLSGFAMGALADRIGMRPTLGITYILLSASSLMVLWHPSVTVLWVAAIAFSFAFYPIFGLVPGYVSKRFGAKRATLVFAVANVTLGIGGMAGNTVGGYVKTMTGTFFWVYLFVAAAALLALALVSMLESEHQENETKLSSTKDQRAGLAESSL